MSKDNNRCDYKMSPNCDGTLKGRNGTPHKVILGPKNGWPDLENPKEETKYACIDCEMMFDED